MVLFILFESSIGYGLFELKEFDEVNSSVDKVQKEIKTFETFSKIAQLKVLPSTVRHSIPSSHPQLPLESLVAHLQERHHSSSSISSGRTSLLRKKPRRNSESAKKILQVLSMKPYKFKQRLPHWSESSLEASVTILLASLSTKNSKI